MARQLDSDGTGSPLATAARHWKSMVAGTLVGGLLGAGAGFLLPVEHTAEARLAVAAGNDSAFAVAGFPVAVRDLAQNYARWVQNNTTDGEWAQPNATSVSATPIPESGVIRVEATSPDADDAVAAADNVAQKLQDEVDQVTAGAQPEAALQEYRKLAPQVSAAWAAVSVAESAFGRSPSAANAAALAEARAGLAEAQLIQDAQGDRYRRLVADPVSVSQLTEIAPAAPAGNDRSSNIAFGGALGGGIGLLLTFLLAALRDWRGRGRREESATATVTRDERPVVTTTHAERAHHPEGSHADGSTGTR